MKSRDNDPSKVAGFACHLAHNMSSFKIDLPVPPTPFQEGEASRVTYVQILQFYSNLFIWYMHSSYDEAMPLKGAMSALIQSSSREMGPLQRDLTMRWTTYLEEANLYIKRNFWP